MDEKPNDPDEISHELRLEGLPYRLLAVRTAGGFHAAWGCDECGADGYCDIRGTPADAIEVAKAGALKHHSESHSPGPGKPR